MMHITCIIIGKDEFGNILKKKAEEAGVDVQYLFSDSHETGSCAVCITNDNTCR